MKNYKTRLLLSLIIAVSFSLQAFAQITLLDYPKRFQMLNQYTSVFICSPNNGTIIQNVHDDTDQDDWANSDRFYEYNNAYVELTQDPTTPAEETIMQRGKGYVLQLGGNPPIGSPRLWNTELNFIGGSANGGPIPVSVTSGQFNLLGNPYPNYLDLDKFLLSANNATKVRGPIILWTHNTLISSANVNPNDPINAYVNSANDFALYNVLGGVAAGRQ